VGLLHRRSTRWSSGSMGKFYNPFRGHHLSVRPLCSKLKEFLDLEQGNCTVYDYARQFNTLAQYGSYHVNIDEKKANLFCEGLTKQLQDRLVQSPNMSYNDLASATIDQKRTMKTCAEAEEKKRKRIMPGSSGSGGSSSAPPIYCMVYTPPPRQLRSPQQQYWGNRPQYQQQ
jgi:hypothetical protein